LLKYLHGIRPAEPEIKHDQFWSSYSQRREKFNRLVELPSFNAQHCKLLADYRGHGWIVIKYEGQWAPIARTPCPEHPSTPS
jgi:hypothetical protein